MNEKLHVRQICFLFGAFTLPLKLITVPALAAKQAHETFWVSALINFALDGLTVLALCILSKRQPNLTVFQIVKNKFGVAAEKILAFAFCLFFFLKGYLPMVEHRNFVEIALYETTPAIWIFLPIFLFTAFFSYKGLRGAGRAADVVIWFSISGIIVIAALSFSVADFSNLLPIIDVPFKKVFKGSVNTCFWFFDSPYLLICLGHFKPEKKQTLKICSAFAIFSAIAIAYMLMLQCEFGVITERQFFTPIKMGKYIVTTSNIGRIDYIAVFNVVMSCAFGVGLPFVFSTLCLEKSFSFKHKIAPCLIINGCAAILLVLTENYYFIIRSFFQSNLAPLFLFFSLFPLPLFFCKNNENTEITQKENKKR